MRRRAWLTLLTPLIATTLPLELHARPKKAPDLVVDRVSFDKQCRVGFRVRNVGAKRVSADLARASLVTIDYGLGAREFSLSKADKNGRLRKKGGAFQHVVPTRFPLAGVVKVAIDPNHIIKEANEGNNRASARVPRRCWAKGNNPRRVPRLKKLARRTSQTPELKVARAAIVKAQRKLGAALVPGTNSDASWKWTATLKNEGNVKLTKGSIRFQAEQGIFVWDGFIYASASGFTLPWTLSPNQTRSRTSRFNRCTSAQRLRLTAYDARTNAWLGVVSAQLPRISWKWFDIKISFDPSTKKRRFEITSLYQATTVDVDVQCVFRDATSTNQSNWTERGCGGKTIRLAPGQTQVFEGTVPWWQPQGMRGVIFAKLTHRQNANLCPDGKDRNEIATESYIMPISGWTPD